MIRRRGIQRGERRNGDKTRVCRDDPGQACPGFSFRQEETEWQARIGLLPISPLSSVEQQGVKAACSVSCPGIGKLVSNNGQAITMPLVVEVGRGGRRTAYHDCLVILHGMAQDGYDIPRWWLWVPQN